MPASTRLYSDVSAQMNDIRAEMMKDEKTALMMDALRGKNINDDDKQGEGVDMMVVETRASGDVDDVLPTVYSPDALANYFGKRPGAVAQRVLQIVTTSSGFLAAVLKDAVVASITNMSEKDRADQEVARAASLRNTIVSLGPFFIKLGQALSIRPDILSPRAMVELQQLCDKVPSFSSKLAMKTIEEELKDVAMECEVLYDLREAKKGQGSDPLMVQECEGDVLLDGSLKTVQTSTIVGGSNPNEAVGVSVSDSVKSNGSGGGDAYITGRLNTAAGVDNPVVNAIFSDISPEPVAAASLGQVYKATLRATGESVAVKVQRPFVLETVSLDLFLVRSLGLFTRNFLPQLNARLDLVSLLDEFANNFYQELDYELECANGLRIAEDMKLLPSVKIPKNYPTYTSRRVHTAEWVEGEKLSQSTADDVGSLVNLGVITYLTQLLETGFFHADPHPGNMMRTPDGQLVILDFGLMTKITDDQKFGMIEAIAHLIHRDYDKIGEDFVNLDFIPKEVDTRPIIPALARVFDAALAGGGAKSINFQELASDLAEITFKFPFQIPPYFALVIRAISVLEGIALVGNPAFAIVDEAYPFISKRLMTSPHPRLKAAFRYMVYGQGETIDVDRMIDMLTALEKFIAVKEYADGSAFKVDGKRGGLDVGRAGDAKGTRSVADVRYSGTGDNAASVLSMDGDMPVISTTVGASATGTPATTPSSPSPIDNGETEEVVAREALKFFFSDEGVLFRDIVVDEVTASIDALSRDAARELVVQLLTIVPAAVLPPAMSGLATGRLRGGQLPSFLKALAPKLSREDRKVVDNTIKLVQFFIRNGDEDGNSAYGSQFDVTALSRLVTRAENRKKLLSLAPLLRDYRESIREFGGVIVSKLVDKVIGRVLDATSKAIFDGAAVAGRGQRDGVSSMTGSSLTGVA